MRETAEKIFTEPFVSVHRRHLKEDIYCEVKIVLCNSSELQ